MWAFNLLYNHFDATILKKVIGLFAPRHILQAFNAKKRGVLISPLHL